MSKILNSEVTPEDLALYQVYSEKNKFIGENIHSWVRIGLIVNSGIAAILVLFIKPLGESGPLNIISLSWQELLPIAGLCLLGLFFSWRWLEGYKSMSEWQIRTNAILSNLEQQFIQPQFINSWQQNADKKELSLEQCGLWTMINTFEPPIKQRPKRDVVDRFQVPLIFLLFWAAMLAIALSGMIF